MKLKQIALFFLLMLISSLSFGQKTPEAYRKLSLGLNTFSYHDNMVSRFGIKGSLAQTFSGAFIKFQLKKFQLRGGYDYAQNHIKYVLSEEIGVNDYDEGVDANYKQHKIYIGIEKDFLKTILRPYAFVDATYYLSKYKGDKWEFSGWDLQTTSYRFDLKSKAVGVMLGLGIKYNLSKNILINYEASIETGSVKVLNDDPHHVMPTSILAYHPINVLGISYTFK